MGSGDIDGRIHPWLAQEHASKIPLDGIAGLDEHQGQIQERELHCFSIRHTQMLPTIQLGLIS